MKRILALDGGGIRGVFTLEVLLHAQNLLREHYGNPNLVLSDHFDFFAGTSTGGIIAACLCWGMDVQEVLNLYVEFGNTMFTRVPWYRPIKRYFISKFKAQPLSDKLLEMFSEKDESGKMVPALMSSKLLLQKLLVVVRNHSTGSQWPLTNNPNAKYNDPTRADSNLKIPLWQVLRASTAAPVYFDPEVIELDGRKQIFVDGSITPYNNPALIAALTAILPCYNMNWATGPENLRIVSLGTLRFSSALPEGLRKMWLGYNAAKIPPALIQGIAWEQDYICRCMGECIFGEELDSEIGTLMPTGDCRLPGQAMFGYVRYNQSYGAAAARELLKEHPNLSQLEAVAAIPELRKIGREYAQTNVKIEHLV